MLCNELTFRFTLSIHIIYSVPELYFVNSTHDINAIYYPSFIF